LARAEGVFPDKFHSVPVLIQLPCLDKTVTGTGIYLNESNKIFLVTAAHVLFNLQSTNSSELISSNATLSTFASENDSREKLILKADLKLLNDWGVIKRHRIHDVVVVLLAITESNTNVTQPMTLIRAVTNCTPALRTFFVSWETSNCLPIDAICDGNELYILGYPVELFNERIPAEVDFEYPLVRKGVVSQKNRHTGKLIIDSGVYGGNSGGPVLVTQRVPEGTAFKVAGLITQFVPVGTRIFPQIGATNSVLVNSGYSVVEPIDYAFELMRQF
jgi:hypothetical protein